MPKSADNQSISIVIPVYNERRGIGPTLRRVAALLDELPAGSEAILVDDGSTDGTGEFLEKLVENAGDESLRLVHHPRNRGYGASLKTGIRHARNPLVAIADADGTYPLERIPELASVVESGRARMAIGSRPASQQPLVRRPAKWVLRRLAEYLTGEEIPDMNSGLRVFLKEDAERLGALLPDGFSFTTTITMAILTEGHIVEFTPIRYKTRVGRSKIKPVRDTGNFLLLICQTTLAFNPLRVFGPVGALLLALGFLFLVLRLILPEPVGIATTIMLFVGGFIILAVGLLADLINRRSKKW